MALLALDRVFPGEVLGYGFPTLSPETSLAEAFRLMQSEGLEDVPVTDPADPRRLLGMLSRADLIGAYDRTVASLSALPVSAWLTTGVGRWSDQFRVIMLAAPPAWIGRSRREIDCRARYGVAVLAVQHESADGYEMPEPDRPLAAGDRLVLAGSTAGLTRVQAS